MPGEAAAVKSRGFAEMLTTLMPLVGGYPDEIAKAVLQSRPRECAKVLQCCSLDVRWRHGHTSDRDSRSWPKQPPFRRNP
jgi:hypothetical protein